MYAFTVLCNLWCNVQSCTEEVWVADREAELFDPMRKANGPIIMRIYTKYRIRSNYLTYPYKRTVIP